MDAGTEAFPRRTIAVLITALLVLVVGGAWFYQAQKATVRQQAEGEFAAIGRLKAKQIEAWRNERLSDAAVLAESLFFRRGLPGFFTDPNDVTARELLIFLHNFVAHGPYADAFLVDPEGRVRLRLGGDNGLHIGYKQALAKALTERRPVFTDLHIEEHDPVPHISVVAPVFSGNQPDASPLGAVVLISNAVQFLYPMLHSWPGSSATAETYLVRRDGDKALFLNNLRFLPETALRLRIPLSQKGICAVKAVLGQQGYAEGRDYRGVRVMSWILPVPDSPWIMVVKEDSAEVFHRWHVQAILILALLAALFGGVGSFALIAWQRHQKRYYRTLYRAEAGLRASLERQSITLKAIGDGIITTDIQGKVELMNPVAEALTGWPQTEACGRPLDEVFHIINEETREPVPNPVTMVLKDGVVVGLANHTILIARNGIERPVADSAAPVHDTDGTITGVVLVFREQTKERQANRFIQVRLALQEFAATNSLEALLTKILDETGALVYSPIGFFHFVEEDQKTLSLQQWSSRTRLEFCRAVAGRGMHCDIDQAGVWGDCIRQKRPVVHNDVASLPHKKGLPEGHAGVVRELVVPIVQGEKVVAVLGVGNKPEPYTESDVEMVSYLAGMAWLMVDKKRTEQMLQESEERYRDLFENAPIGIFSTTSKGKVISINNVMARILGFDSPREALEHYTDLGAILYVHPEQRDRFLREIREGGHIENFEYQAYTADRRTVWLRMNARIVRYEEDGSFIIDGFTADVTAQHSVEAQLFQAQKMESVGRLAGGVAHDFNNMLNVIVGYAELALEKVTAEQPLHDNLLQIHRAAIRSADVTRQLLAFARKQTISPQVIDINTAVEGMLTMLRRLIGEGIDLRWAPRKDLWPIKMDPSQLDQILANLCVNARDAIAGIGNVTIETNEVSFDRAYCDHHPGFIPGDYVMLAVSDDGCGMDKDTLQRLFEPFFTTKKTGEGTGLGLATVYGIVKQNNGFINVYSEPDRGTAFKIYIPRQNGKVSFVPQENAEEIPLGHGENLLVVEDEIATLDLCKTMLERLNYSVVATAAPNEAIRLIKEEQRISLLVTDVVMPEINGRDLANRIQSLSPGVRVLFMSGYTSNVIAHHGVLDQDVNFLQKPFSLRELAVGVRKALEKS